MFVQLCPFLSIADQSFTSGTIGTGAIFPLNRVGEVAWQLHEITLGGASKPKAGKRYPFPYSHFAVSTNWADRLVFYRVVWNRRVWGFLRGFILKIRRDGA